MVFSRSGSTAGSPTIRSSIVPSIPNSPSLESIALDTFVGRRESAGLYLEEGFVAGGGMEMLALPMFPPNVPTSANRLFRLGRAALLGAERSECEGTRPVDAREGDGFEELAEVEEVDLSIACSCVSASSDAVSEMGSEAVLPLLVVRDKEAISVIFQFSFLTDAASAENGFPRSGALHGWSGYRQSLLKQGERINHQTWDTRHHHTTPN